jgi:hypothetical protein
MDSFTIKPRPGVQKFTTRDPRQASATELHVSKTVTAADNRDTSQRDRPHDHAPAEVIVDPEALNVINRENEIRNQADNREHPDQALLRLRAYRPATRPEADPPSPNEPHANIKA